jgi:hypothetical protein
MSLADLDDTLESNPQSLVGQSYNGNGIIPIQDEQFALYRGDSIVILDSGKVITEVIERERLWSVTTL